MNMSFQKLTLRQSWFTTWHFLIALWNQNPKKFVAKGIGLGAYLNFVDWEYEKDIDWRQVYYQTTFKSWDDRDVVSQEELLKVLRLLLEKASGKYGFELFEVKKIVDTLQMQEEYEAEFMIWKKAIVQGISELELPAIRSYWD